MTSEDVATPAQSAPENEGEAAVAAVAPDPSGGSDPARPRLRLPSTFAGRLRTCDRISGGIAALEQLERSIASRYETFKTRALLEPKKAASFYTRAAEMMDLGRLASGQIEQAKEILSKLTANTPGLHAKLFSPLDPTPPAPEREPELDPAPPPGVASGA